MTKEKYSVVYRPFVNLFLILYNFSKKTSNIFITVRWQRTKGAVMKKKDQPLTVENGEKYITLQSKVPNCPADLAKIFCNPYFTFSKGQLGQSSRLQRTFLSNSHQR